MCKSATTQRIESYRENKNLFCSSCWEFRKHFIYKIALGLGKECLNCGHKETYKGDKMKTKKLFLVYNNSDDSIILWDKQGKEILCSWATNTSISEILKDIETEHKEEKEVYKVHLVLSLDILKDLNSEQEKIKTTTFKNHDKQIQEKQGEDKTIYSGINILLLWIRQSDEGFETSEWLTFWQAKNLGGSVKKGEKATPILFYKKLEVTDKENKEETKTIYIHKKHFIFNISQTEGLENLINKPSPQDKPVFQDEEQAEKLIKASQAEINFAPVDRAFYLPEKDKIVMPKKQQFKTKEKFYSTMFHELSHWTAHKSRLDRPIKNKQGSKVYTFEELIAEISASFICCHLGFKYSTQHSAYIKSWLDVLKEDKKAIFKASSKAQKV